MNKYVIAFVLISTSILLISFYFPYLLDAYFQPASTRNEFGDSFGALNTIFSGLAFAGVIVTVWMQQNELNLQKEELQETRKEFVSNRITNIVYKQLEIVERYHNKLSFGTNSGIEGLKQFISWQNPDHLILDDFKPEELCRIRMEPVNKYKHDILDYLESLYGVSKTTYLAIDEICSNKEENKFFKSLFFRNIDEKYILFIYNIKNQISQSVFNCETQLDYKKYLGTYNLETHANMVALTEIILNMKNNIEDSNHGDRVQIAMEFIDTYHDKGA